MVLTQWFLPSPFAVVTIVLQPRRFCPEALCYESLWRQSAFPLVSLCSEELVTASHLPQTVVAR